MERCESKVDANTPDPGFKQRHCGDNWGNTSTDGILDNLIQPKALFS